MMRRDAGYTLAEVVVAIAVGMIIIAAIYAAISAAQRFTGAVDRKVVAHQDARSVLDLMATEIQMASFDANMVTNLWRNAGNCTDPSANQTYKGIQVATATTLTIQADINENSSLIPTGTPNQNPNEIITYNYDTGNQYITRSTSCGDALPLLGDRPTSGRPRGVRVINTAAVPVFRYFNARGAEILPASLPAAIPDIARIDLTLWVETEDTVATTGQGPKRTIYSTSVIPRNHGINVTPP